MEAGKALGKGRLVFPEMAAEADGEVRARPAPPCSMQVPAGCTARMSPLKARGFAKMVLGGGRWE